MTRNELTELLERIIPEYTPLTYLMEVNREITFEHPDGRLFKVSVEAWWPEGRRHMLGVSLYEKIITRIRTEAAEAMNPGVKAGLSMAADIVSAEYLQSSIDNLRAMGIELPQDILDMLEAE